MGSELGEASEGEAETVELGGDSAMEEVDELQDRDTTKIADATQSLDRFIG